jgi:hypothetical protein
MLAHSFAHEYIPLIEGMLESFEPAPRAPAHAPVAPASRVDPESISLDDAFDEAVRDNDVEVFNGLIDMFESPYLYIRELVQNSLDAHATTVNISVGVDERMKLSTITVEDDGDGMDESILDQYFLNLFESSKEYDHSTIGRFGIGLVSIFAQNPRYVQVETARDGAHPLKVLLGEAKSGAPATIIRPRDSAVTKGTRIMLYADLSAGERNRVAQKLREELDAYCAYTATPLLFNNERINKPFDVAAPIKVRFGGKGLEAIMGLTGKTGYKLMNHRLVIKAEASPLTEQTAGFELLVNSRYIDYNISRNDVIKNKKYQQIKQMVDKARIQLVREAFRYMSEDKDAHDGGGQPADSQMVWSFGIGYLANASKSVAQATDDGFKMLRRFRTLRRTRRLEKTLDDEVLDTNMFQDFEGNPVSIRQVLRALHKQRCIYFSEPCHLANEAKAAGILVMKPYTHERVNTGLSGTGLFGSSLLNMGSSPLTRIISLFAPGKMLDEEFNASTEISHASLDEDQRAFIEELNAELRRVPALRKSIGSIEFGRFDARSMGYVLGSRYSERANETSRPYISKLNSTLSQSVGYGRKRLQAERKSLLERILQGFRASDTIIINPDHEQIKRIVATTGPERIKKIYEFLMTLSSEKGYERRGLHQDVFDAFLARTGVERAAQNSTPPSLKIVLTGGSDD